MHPTVHLQLCALPMALILLLGPARAQASEHSTDEAPLELPPAALTGATSVLGANYSSDVGIGQVAHMHVPIPTPTLPQGGRAPAEYVVQVLNFRYIITQR